MSEPKPKKKGAMFPTGTGGPAAKPKTGKITLEQARKIRKADYGKYKELVKAGKIETLPTT